MGHLPCSAALAGHLPFTAFRVYTQHAVSPLRGTCHAEQLSQGTYHAQLSECTLCMQCRFRRYLYMQCSSCGALVMHSFQSVHLACSAALSGHLPRTAIQSPHSSLLQCTGHAVQLSWGTCHAQPSECTLCMQCRFRRYIHMQCSSLRARAKNSYSEPTF